MKYLKFKVSNTAVSRDPTDKTPLISGFVDYYGMEFEFDESFEEIRGIKAVEFIKKNNKAKQELVNRRCKIPNWILTDKDAFQIRVVSGTTGGTPWQQVSITEGGVVMPEEGPEEEAPEGMEYVKTLSGEHSVALLRSDTNGLEYSTDGGETWNSGVIGVPEVPATPKGAAYLRANGDWVNADDYLAENGGELNQIDSVKVDGVALPIEDKSVNIDLSAYEKTSDAEVKYATRQEVGDLQALTGQATQLSMLEYGETDTATIVSKINEIILVLQARGVVTE